MKNNGSHGILIVSEQMAVVSFWAIVKLQKSFAIATYLMGSRGCTLEFNKFLTTCASEIWVKKVSTYIFYVIGWNFFNLP